jgi:hypothetical protein
MSMSAIWRAAGAGVAGGFFGNAMLGILFTSPPVRAVLYNEQLQSALFLEVTPTRDVAYSVVGLILLSAIHGLLFKRFAPTIPGERWWTKGLAWGGVIWAMYWLFQEWFIYHTLLREPLLLAGVELAILLLGSLAEGLVIAFLVLALHRQDA